MTAMTTAARKDAARAERVNRRRRQVLDAAASLMSETGYHDMSMQALAERADVSVGLIYQYFGGKQELLTAVIVDILEDFRATVPRLMEEAAQAGPTARLTRGIDAFCRIIDAKRAGAVLAYRESKTLDADARATVCELELQTSEPLRRAITDGIADGEFRDVDPDVVVHDILMIVHGWALKHWNLAPRMSLHQYIVRQTDLLLAAIRVPGGGVAG